LSRAKLDAAMAVTAGAGGERLSPTEKLVYVILADHWNDQHGYAYPTLRRIALRAQLQPRQCRKTLEALEAKGLTKRIPQFHDHGGQGQNFYDVFVPTLDENRGGPPVAGDLRPGSGPPPLPHEGTAGDGDEEPPGEGQEHRDPRRPIAAEQVLDRLNEPEEERGEEPSAMPPRSPTVAKPLSHAQRNRFRHEYDDILKTKARSYDAHN
jgi:hypothetical protein